MAISLTEFRDRFKEDLLEIHWRHWTALGVASHVSPEKYWIVDPEAAFVSALTLGPDDKRLLSATIEWLIRNGEWVSFSRLKRIGKAFVRQLPESNEPVLAWATLKLVADTLRKYEQNSFSVTESDPPASEQGALVQYEDIFRAFQTRDIAGQPQVQQPPLLQLLLRGVFGVDARVEVFIYLLFNKSGNSNSIAKEIFYDQKIVYRVLEKWTEAGAVTKTVGKRAGVYSLNRKSKWLNVLDLERPPHYLNWVRTFLLLDRLAKALSTPPWSEDEYLLSSLFRDFLNETKTVVKPLDVEVPEPAPYPGALYFAPFVQMTLELLEHLKYPDVAR